MYVQGFCKALGLKFCL